MYGWAGPVCLQSVSVAFDRRTGEPRGHATVRFAGPAGPLTAASNATDRAVALSGRPLLGPDHAGPAGPGIRVSYSLGDWAPLAAPSSRQPANQAAESRTVAVTGLPGNATAGALRAAFGPAESVHWSRALRIGETGQVWCSIGGVGGQSGPAHRRFCVRPLRATDSSTADAR